MWNLIVMVLSLLTQTPELTDNSQVWNLSGRSDVEAEALFASVNVGSFRDGDVLVAADSYLAWVDTTDNGPWSGGLLRGVWPIDPYSGAVGRNSMNVGGSGNYAIINTAPAECADDPELQFYPSMHNDFEFMVFSDNAVRIKREMRGRDGRADLVPGGMVQSVTLDITYTFHDDHVQVRSLFEREGLGDANASNFLPIIIDSPQRFDSSVSDVVRMRSTHGSPTGEFNLAPGVPHTLVSDDLSWFRNQSLSHDSTGRSLSLTGGLGVEIVDLSAPLNQFQHVSTPAVSAMTVEFGWNSCYPEDGTGITARYPMPEGWEYEISYDITVR